MLRFRRSRPAAAPPASTGGPRVYAIGDIHGRADLLDQLLGMIAHDDAARPPSPVCLLFLGDLTDRGPDSAAVLDRSIALSRSGEDIRFIKGNHEEIFILAARGDEQAVRIFRRIGGDATLASYGLAPSACMAMDDAAIASWMLAHIPRAHVDFMDGFEDMIAIGDYLFVHAGIRPNVALAAQEPQVLRWIRQPFLDHAAPHEKMIVHGHSITDDIDVRSNRIGIDTGAYASGRLTALGLEGEDRWFLQTI